VLAVGIIIAIGVIFGIMSLPKYWHHEIKMYDAKPKNWLWGDAAWWCFVRSFPISNIFMAYVAIFFLWKGINDAVPAWLTIAGISILATFIFFSLTLYLFAWPKVIQFPWVREKPCAADLWKKKLEKRRKDKH